MAFYLKVIELPCRLQGVCCKKMLETELHLGINVFFIFVNNEYKKGKEQMT